MRTHVTLTVPDDAWTDASCDHPARSRLLAPCVVNGVPHHLEAREVIDDAGTQTFVAWPDDANRLAEAVGAEGRWMTVAIAGRDYVVFLSPYCD